MTMREWLAGVDPEGIYLSDLLADDLKSNVDAEATWPTRDLEYVKKSLGPGGEIFAGMEPMLGDKSLAIGSEVIEAMGDRSKQGR